MTKMEDIGKIKVGIFDLDGTLINSNAKVRRDFIETMARLGVDVTHEESLEKWEKIAEKHGISADQLYKTFDERKSWEQSLKDGEVEIFPETHSILDYLRSNGVELALLSRSLPKYTDVKLDYFGLRRYFGAIETISPSAPSKIRGARTLIEKINPEKIGHAWFVGDKEEDVSISRDIEREFGITSNGIYVNRNGGEPKFERGNYRVIKSLEDIPEIMGV